VSIVHEDDQVLIVNKGSSIPIHPTGRFNFNTLLWILAHEYGREPKSLRNINRIDRYTSGLVILAKQQQVASRISDQIRRLKVQKEYVARVRGIFPAQPLRVQRPILFLKDQESSFRLTCDDNGKPAVTEFERLAISLERQESLVLCRPLTGRTHQIRLHLQHLGHPISNDPAYADLPTKFLPAYHASDGDESMLEPQLCVNCRDEPTVQAFDASLYLHALSYGSEGWSFKVPMPSWSSLD
jgi:tRNA pseudouridine synthase 8/2,5-diamino-6-(5-phospho-D-ribitylamino)-pyrimidin-4(3H)-one deaminase